MRIIHGSGGSIRVTIEIASVSRIPPGYSALTRWRRSVLLRVWVVISSVWIHLGCMVWWHRV